jgi:ABC-type sugar transport system ATPase subunit
LGAEVLTVSNIRKSFPGVLALKDVSLFLQRGEILGICGENGAGKSTLLKILSGAYPAGSFSGSILVNGTEISFASPLEAERAGIVTIYQEIALVENMSVADNIIIGSYKTKAGWIDDKDLHQRTREILKDIKLQIDPEIPIRNLNTGKRQMIAIAKALIKNPKIILLDEPTSALTSQETGELFRIIRRLQEKGISSIYISHKMNELFELCGRLYVMRDGIIANEFDKKDFNENRILESMVGRNIDTVFEKSNVPHDEYALEVRNLSTIRDTNSQSTQIKNVSFNLKKGEILGFAGLVGSGRSETVNAIFGASKTSDETVILIDGNKVKIGSPLDAIKNNIALLTEDRKVNGLIMGLDIRNNVVLPSLKKAFRKLFVKESMEKVMAQKYFEQLRIKAPGIYTTVKNLSGGNQQKVIFAKWMLTKPSIMLLDEPTRGIDVGAKSEIYSIINELANNGVSVIFISSEMPELIAMCDRILVFRNGKVAAELPREKITQLNIIAAAAGSAGD